MTRPAQVMATVRTAEILAEAARGVHEAVQATLDLARGLGLAGTLTDDTRRRDRLITRWASMLDDARYAEPGQ